MKKEETMAQDFRLLKLAEIQKELQTECHTRTTLSRNYKRGLRILTTIDDVLILLASALSMSGVAVLTTLVSIPIALPIMGIATGVGGLCLINSQISRRLSIRLQKHENIKMLAESKLNSINDLISKALDDGDVTDAEYSMILGELTKFKEMKEQIYKRVNDNICKEKDGSLLSSRRRDLIDTFRNAFTPNVNTNVAEK